MKYSKFRFRICLFLLVCNLVFIWGNSLLPGSVSGAISSWLKDTMFWFLSSGSAGTGHGLLRKLAHFTEFSCLGICFSWLFSMLRRPIGLSALCGIAAAGIDEFIQIFVPDRGPGIADVLLDSCGVVFGVLVLSIVIYLQKKKQNNQEDHGS